jgi:hypothetical protein
MNLETFLTILCFALLVVCYVGYRYCSENVYATYKEQRVGANKKTVKEGKKK